MPKVCVNLIIKILIDHHMINRVDMYCEWKTHWQKHVDAQGKYFENF